MTQGVNLRMPADAQRRSGPSDSATVKSLQGLSSEEVAIRAAERGHLDGLGEFVARTLLLDIFRGDGYRGNVRTLKADLERWQIRCRPSDGCPSTADLKAAVSDGRIMISSEQLPDVAALSRIRSPHERRFAAKELLSREDERRRHLERLDIMIEREARLSDTRLERIERVLDDIDTVIGPERPLDLGLDGLSDDLERRRQQARRWPGALS